MYRHLVLIAALALAAPDALGAQTPVPVPVPTPTERDRERIERERERTQELRDRAMEHAQEVSARALERAQRSRERSMEHRAHAAAAALDTVVPFDAHGSVTVSCPGGAVVVTTGDRAEVRVRARTETGAIRFSSSGTRASLEPASERGCSDGRFEVVVPTGSRVTANTWTGSIMVRGVAGNVDAHAMSGDVDIRDAGARVDIESLSGDVTVHEVKGDATVHTVSGSVTLDGARGPVDVETVSGDVQLRDVSARQVRSRTTNGDLAFSGTIADGGRYEFETHSGDLTLHLPASVGAELSMSTYSGGIESDFPITLRAGEQGMGGSTSRRMDFSLGHGSARIVAATFSGDITLTSSGRRQ